MFKYDKIARYTNVNPFVNGLATFYDRLERTWKIIDMNGNETKINGDYSKIECFSEGKAAVKSSKTGLWGYINTSGEEIISCRFTTADYFIDGFASVKNESPLYAYINERGEEITPYKYNSACYFSEGFAIVKIFKGSDTLNAFINEKGETIYETNDNIFSFSSGVGIIHRDGVGYNFLNGEGHLISKDWYSNLQVFSCGLAAVRDRETNLWGYIDMSGTLKVKCQYKWASRFEDGRATVLKDGDYIIIDTNGNIIETCEKTSDCEIVPITYNGKKGYIFLDSEGNIANKVIYEMATEYKDGLSQVIRQKEPGKYIFGYVNTRGEEVIACNFRNRGEFHCGRATIRNEEGLYGYIDETGKEVIPCQYIRAEDFSSDFAFVRNEHLEAVIDKNGNIIVPFSRSIIYDNSSKIFRIIGGEEHKYEDIGFVDKNGKIIKDLSQLVFVNRFKIGDVEKELIAETEEGLRDLMLKEIRMYESMLNGPTSSESAVKSIGVYPGTEQPKA